MLRESPLKYQKAPTKTQMVARYDLQSACTNVGATSICEQLLLGVGVQGGGLALQPP